MDRTLGFRQTQVLIVVEFRLHGLSRFKIEHDLAECQLQLHGSKTWVTFGLASVPWARPQTQTENTHFCPMQFLDPLEKTTKCRFMACKAPASSTSQRSGLNSSGWL